MRASPEPEAAQARVDPNAFHYQEVLFSLIMSVAALFSREDPGVRYPDVLWAFTAMLAFNLACQLVLRRRLGSRLVPLASIAVNTLLISMVVALSGGDQSRFWPVYLLPIFTACLYLERRHVASACAAAGAFLACFYLEAFWGLRRWEACEFLIKLSVLAFAAAVTAHLSFKERAQRLALDAQREKIAALARSLDRRTASDLLAMKQQSLDALIPGIAHALGNPLAVILASAELLLRELPAGSAGRQDLERIRAAARRCAQVTDDLSAYAAPALKRTR